MATRIATLTYRLQDDASAALLRIAAAEEKVGAAGRTAQGGMQAVGSGADQVTKKVVAADVASQALRGTLMGLGAGALLGGLAGLVAGFIGVGKASLAARGQFAAYQASLEAMTGSHAQALAISKEVAAFADRTPFQTATLEKATQELLAYNFSAAELIPTLTIAGDTVARFGDLSADKLQEVVKALALVKQAAGGTGEGLEILRRFGVTQTELMAQGVRFNQRTGEFLNVPINRLNLYNAVQRVLLKNQGQMALQAEELPGLYSTFESAMRKLGAAIGEQLEPAAKEFLRTATAMARAATAFIEGGGLQQIGSVLSLLVPLLRTAGIFLGLLVAQRTITGILALAKAMTLLGRANIWLLGLSVALELILRNAWVMATLRKLWEQFLPVAKQVWDKIWLVIGALKNFIDHLPPPAALIVETGAALLAVALLSGKLVALAAGAWTVVVAAATAVADAALVVTAGLARALAATWTLLVQAATAVADAALVLTTALANALKATSPITLLVTVAGAAVVLGVLAAIVTALGGLPAVREITVTAINAVQAGVQSVLDTLHGLPSGVHVPVTAGAPSEAPVGSVSPGEVPATAPAPVAAAAPALASVGSVSPAPSDVGAVAPVITTAPIEAPVAAVVPTPVAGGIASIQPVISPVGLGGFDASAAGGVPIGPPGPPVVTAPPEGIGGGGSMPDLGTGAALAAGIAALAAAGAIAALSGISGGGCFARETLILTPEGARPIHTIVAGDRVLSWSVTQARLIERLVLRTFVHARCQLLEVVLADGTSLQVTPAHLLYSEGRWRPAASCSAGAVLHRVEGGALVITRVVRVLRLPPATVHNLEVAAETFDDHTYVAGGIVVHNAKVGEAGFGFAEGGIVTRPTRALIGEAGPEAVIPLSRAGSGFGGTAAAPGPTINITLAGGVYATREALSVLADQIGEVFTRKMRLSTSTALMRA